MKTFINISTDKIGIYGLGNPQILERNDIDKELGKVLVNLDKEFGIHDCLVLNGPGGFTNLRVGTLTLNLLKTLKRNSITFYSISKPELYHIFYIKGRIPRYGILYIGQKSNVRLRDLEEGKLINLIKKNEITEFEKQYGPLFFDQTYDENYFQKNNHQICFNFSGNNIILGNKQENKIKWEELIFNKVENLEANYMIEPNIG